MPLHYFLIVFDLDRQELVSHEQFDDRERAMIAYAEAEEQHRGDRNLEIVLIGADTLETIQRTHSNYFAVRSSSPYLAGTR